MSDEPDALANASNLVGVLDIDSPSVAQFSAEDQAGVELVCATYCELQSGSKNFI